jgi:cytochrome P450
MLIPKNATVVVPVYALHHTHCTNPALYDPDRYRTNLKTAYQNASRPDYENRDHYAFGTGRRLCPGIHMGERTVWRMTAKILWAFEIKHAADAEGKEVVLDPDNYIEGMATQPAPFKVRFVPRSQKHVQVIRHAVLNVEEILRQWE